MRASQPALITLGGVLIRLPSDCTCFVPRSEARRYFRWKWSKHQARYDTEPRSGSSKSRVKATSVK